MRPELIEGFLETGIISPARMRAVDINATALGVSDLQLMESAGRALADRALAMNPDRVLVLCGKGNNGGDGMVAARHLQRGVTTDVCYLDSGKEEWLLRAPAGGIETLPGCSSPVPVPRRPGEISIPCLSMQM